MTSGRNFLKAHDWGSSKKTSDQQKGVDMPEVFKSHQGFDLIPLPDPQKGYIEEKPFLQMISDRRSRRKYTGEAISMEELSYLLYTHCGVTKESGPHFFRAYPSGGNRQTFETYLAIQTVEGLQTGIYRYTPKEHALIFLKKEEDLGQQLSHACVGQTWVKKAAVTFLWSSIPYRGEWRYMDKSHKVILLDAGHLCQNLYLACEALGHVGTCAIGAYDQRLADQLIDVDGEEEFVVYMAPVGVRA